MTFPKVIHAYHRLIELKHKWTDPEVLRVLVRAVSEDLRDARGAPSARLRVKLRKLLGHVVATGSVDSLIWELYANLLLGNTDRSEEDSEQVVTSAGNLQVLLYMCRACNICRRQCAMPSRPQAGRESKQHVSVP